MAFDGLLPSNSLEGMRVGLSVSASDDLGRLGLSAEHAEQAVAEVARAVLVAGGSLVYGGRVKPSGFTQYLMHEVLRYGHGDRTVLTLCLAAPEHQKLSRDELDEIDRTIGTSGRIVCLDTEGHQIEDILSAKAHDLDPVSQADVPRAYSLMRRYLATISDTRVLIGGQLSGFAGVMPGIVEEAVVAVEAGQPLYVSAGFGGAAALVAQRLNLDDLSWAPNDFPARPHDERIDLGLDLLGAAARSSGWIAKSCGLDQRGIRQLAASHRASEIASLVVRGLAQTRR